MTPAAITPAGRSTAKRGRPATITPRAAPKAPRRVSGPASGRSAGITLPRPGQGGGIALPRPGQGGGIALPRPGRGGVVNPRPRPTRGATRQRSLPLPRRLARAIRALPDHPLLDRVVRGRAWIAVLGVMLAGIVAMQIEVLKLGASIGRSLQQGSTLQNRNEQLRASVAGLADDQRIEKLAATMGMVMPAPDGVGFVSARPGMVQKAIANIHQPNTQAFLALSAAGGALPAATGATGTTLGALPGAGTTGTTGAGTTGTTAAGTTGAGTTGTTTSTGTPAAGTPVATGTAGVTSPAATTTQTTGSSGSSPASPATASTTQPATPQTTSSSPVASGVGGGAALAPSQSPSPTAGTGGAGVPAAG